MSSRTRIRAAREARGEAFLKRIQRPYAEYKRAHPQGNLCQRCAGIDWSLLLPSGGSHYCEGKHYLVLFGVAESSQELSASSCPLCQSLSSKQSFGEDRDRGLKVRCACYGLWHPHDHLRVHLDRDWTHHAPLLELTSSSNLDFSDRSYILQDSCAAAQGYVMRRLTPELIDYEIFRCWLKHCKLHHTTKCNPTFTSSIPGLRVFDCKTRKVIAAPEDTGFRYVALSYVWGGAQASEKEQAILPATIRDAITVVLEIGYRYLWIDQLCILQSNETHKQAQIKLMGRIYAESELVIIAAAGSSSHYGLPGVSTRPRQAQRMIRLDPNVELIEMFDTNSEIANSTWATRGWTHQEGYLATRRLIFTDKEVFYLCDRGVWQESVQRPGVEDCITYGRNRYTGFPLDHGSKDRVSKFLADYSRRKISVDADILNACIGILGKLVDRHFWGIVASIIDPYLRSSLSLKWGNVRPGHKRTGFPSWSWAATTGRKYVEADTPGSDRDFLVEVLTTDGRWLTPASHVESRYDPLPEGSGPTLRLTGLFYTVYLVMNPRFNTYGGHKEHWEGNEEALESEPLVVFKNINIRGDDNEFALKLCPDTKDTNFVLQDHFKAVLIEVPKYSGRGSGLIYPFTYMVLQGVGDNYRRIGITGCDYWFRERSSEIFGREVWQFPNPDRGGDKEVIYVE